MPRPLTFKRSADAQINPKARSNRSISPDVRVCVGGTRRRRQSVLWGEAQQANYAQKMIDELKAGGVDPKHVWAQSFNKDDVFYWIQNEPRFGRQAVYLDSIDPTVVPPIPRQTIEQLKELKKKGVRIMAPPIPALLSVSASGEIAPSQYALDIKSLGFDIITWSFERSDLRRGAAFGGFYYLFDAQGQAIKKDSDMYKALDVLARQVDVSGIFSDWPATVTYYANCMGLK